ncbi:hypothetical protein [Kribbella sp. CA-293567]|uniref:hypothetical protein n=1 Tax=Kribbella sp. CA-293567 TaxID=3002436 RepID=UPI0022DD469C|nr:hypothetical protein [Kribbella sp. CA-293567]WBQ04196.1 hypothetical protein OX958_30040 [Kribbella sp. CA-293567]
MYGERDDLDPARPALFGIPPDAVADERPDPRPEDARRIGLSRHTEEGAVVFFASSLNRAKPGHKMMAWLLLLTYSAPVLYILLTLI